MMFQKITKLSANNASNDVHCPPPPLVDLLPSRPLHWGRTSNCHQGSWRLQLQKMWRTEGEVLERKMASKNGVNRWRIYSFDLKFNFYRAMGFAFHRPSCFCHLRLDRNSLLCSSSLKGLRHLDFWDEQIVVLNISNIAYLMYIFKEM